jgi:hypothetical protein
MDQEQQRLVRASFAKVAPIADTAAAMFYERLFATDPTLRSLYKDDMVVQGGATRDMGSRRRTMTRLPEHCSGRCSRPLAPSSLPPCAMRGSLGTKYSQAR